MKSATFAALLVTSTLAFAQSAATTGVASNVPHGSSKAQACEKATDSASSAAEASRAVYHQNKSVQLSSCDCSQEAMGWKCLVRWSLR